MNNSFTSSDYINAKETFINWQGKICESVESYVLRQRKAELRELVKKVVKNELSDYDQMIVQLRWYENYSVIEIAEKLGVDRTTVNRHLEKINGLVMKRLYINHTDQNFANIAGRKLNGVRKNDNRNRSI